MTVLGIGLVGWVALILLAIQFARAAAKSRPTPEISEENHDQ